MFKHLLKLIWNKKKHHLLLVVEILVSFLVIFSLTSMLVYYYRNYAQPVGIDDKNIWQVNYDNADKPSQPDSLQQFYALFYQQLKTLPEIEEVTFISNNAPYSSNMHREAVSRDDKKEDNVDYYEVSETYGRMIHPDMLEGRWYTKEDLVGKNRPVVIGESLRDKLFPNENAEGKLLTYEKEKFKVVGVAREPKIRGDFMEVNPSVYFPPDTLSMKWNSNMLLKVNSAVFHDATFEGKVYKLVAGFLKGANVEIQHLDDKHRAANRLAIIPVILLLIVSTFLIVNVALGTFGVLWYNINKRKGEIGLRRAIGATGGDMNRQLIGESMVIATFSLLLGTFFAIQFPLLNVFNIAASTYIIALVLSVLFIYLLVLICSIYPGQQAAAIFPATALHED
ncbi:MAG: ABC transporter permease [Chitinophaga sp.]|uniref:ABC transporter permease n=1 Tax=Chitinophaga sp. TaxID=1869181 RepID=UPI0025C73BEE|nr:ABC transporter permease [Chitinophaga sp.]MBV8251973.1 ABC transporter permease [Chitinophaga sp.]